MKTFRRFHWGDVWLSRFRWWRRWRGWHWERWWVEPCKADIWHCEDRCYAERRTRPTPVCRPPVICEDYR